MLEEIRQEVKKKKKALDKELEMAGHKIKKKKFKRRLERAKRKYLETIRKIKKDNDYQFDSSDEEWEAKRKARIKSEIKTEPSEKATRFEDQRPKKNPENHGGDKDVRRKVAHRNKDFRKTKEVVHKDKDYREKEDKELGDESRETKPYSQVNNKLKDPAVDEPEMLLGNELDLSLKLKKTEHRTK